MYGGMGYGGGMGGGMGGYGGYGGYGSYGGMGGGGMYGGMPGYGMQPGAPFDPNQPTLTQTLESTTQNTFALLHSIVQTFGGVAQMLESTFFATHSSFFAMVGVVDQIGQLRAALGSVLGLFGLVRWMRDLVTGRRAAGGMQGEFRDFVNGRPVQPQGAGQPPRASKKPLVIFLLAIFGIPYAMHKLVRMLVERQQALAEQQQGALPPLDPSQLTFARALYPFEASSPAELALKENEIVAVMGKLDPATGAEVDPRLEVRFCLRCGIRIKLTGSLIGGGKRVVEGSNTRGPGGVVPSKMGAGAGEAQGGGRACGRCGREEDRMIYCKLSPFCSLSSICICTWFLVCRSLVFSDIVHTYCCIPTSTAWINMLISTTFMTATLSAFDAKVWRRRLEHVILHE